MAPGTRLSVLIKAARRRLRDVALGLRPAQRVRAVLGLLALLFLALLVLLLRLLPERPPFGTPACGCPVDARELQPLLRYARTALVARVGRRGALHPLAALLGPPGLAARPLAVAPADVNACGLLPRGTLAVVLLGPVARAAHANASAPTAPLFECARVWAAPWQVWRPALEARAGASEWWRAPHDPPAALWRDAVAAAAARPAARPPTAARAEWWIRDGVTVVAACMDRAGTLRTAAASWFAARGVAEVVLVDWSSAAPAVLALPRSLRSDSRLVVVRVEGQREWALSRAYNLGVQLASRAVVLKVDCDTHLHADFLQRHPLRAGEFYAGDWRALRTPLSEKLHVNGLLLARRDDILAVGGYDERITTYGWDDSDVALRLSATREHLRFDYASVAHLVHPAALRVSHQRRAALLAPGHPLAAAVEIQRNRLLLTRFNLPAWRARSPHTVWDVETRSSPHARAGPGVFGRAARVTPSRERLPLVLVASAASEVASATELVSDADALDVAKRAIRVVLQRYGTPALPKTLTLPFYKTLLTKVAYPTRYAETALALRGGCLSRLLAHSAALVVSSASEAGSAQAPEGSAALFERAAQSPPTGFIGWRVRQYWNFPNTECGCRFFDAFQAKRSEISAAWSNNAEKVRFVAYRAGLLPTDVRAVLSSFKTHATPKNLTADVAEWTAAAAVSSNASAARRPPRILLAQLACDVAPRDVSAAHAQAMRAVLRELVPTEQVRAAVLRSLQTPNGTVLDNPELQERAWTDLLGPDAAKQLNAVFASAAMRDMARAWGAGAVSEERLLFHLHRRAAALVVAMRINGNKEARGKIFERLDEGRRTDLRAVVDHLEVRFRSLFHECPDHASRYLDAYPELAMVVAGLLSANFCMT